MGEAFGAQQPLGRQSHHASLFIAFDLEFV